MVILIWKPESKPKPAKQPKSTTKRMVPKKRKEPPPGQPSIADLFKSKKPRVER
jgi:hypothetical protein